MELTYKQKLKCIEYIKESITCNDTKFICIGFDRYIYNLMNYEIYSNMEKYFPELYIIIMKEGKKNRGEDYRLSCPMTFTDKVIDTKFRIKFLNKLKRDIITKHLIQTTLCLIGKMIHLRKSKSMQ